MVRKGQVLNERYELLSLEGEGGMAFVYKAQDLELERTVALKILRPGYDTDDVFRHEARAAAKLPHANIVNVYDVGQDGDVQYIVMEYVEGQNLKDLILDGMPLRVGRALGIIIQVCEALGFAHDRGIIHCDLKPQNVLVLPGDRVKVTDFGIARAFSAVSADHRGEVWGTPYYAAPELVAGKPLTPASDVYAIGVMLYEMLAGRLPFEGQSPAEIARQHALNAPPPIENYNPRVPRYIRQVLDRALAKDPASRYQTAKDLARHLVAYRQHSQVDTQPLALAPPTPAKQEEQPAQATAPVQVAPQPQPSAKVDWPLLLLIGMAFLAVMGLLPLWGTVISRALSQPTPVPTVTPALYESTPTPTQVSAGGSTPSPPTPTAEGRVSVPGFAGQALDEARQEAKELGLTLTITGQQHDAQVPAAHVISQHPQAGEQVSLGSEVGVVVSLGPELVIMPAVIGFPAVVEELELADLGLTVTVTEAWSVEPAGLVISQTPSSGTEVSVGSVVTLTVSSGPRGQVGANFDHKLLLASAEFNGTTFRPGDAVQIIVTWQVLARLPERYTTFIHIVGQDGRILTQRDVPPLGGSRPTNTWQPGEQLFDPYIVTLPRQAAPGTYWVQIGLYRGDLRLPIVDPGAAEAKGNALVLRQITVRGD